MSNLYADFKSLADELFSEFEALPVNIQRGDVIVGKTRCLFTAQLKTNQQGSASTTEDTRAATLAAFKGIPEVGDHLIFKNADLTIMELEVIQPQPGGIVLAYKVQVK